MCIVKKSLGIFLKLVFITMLFACKANAEPFSNVKITTKNQAATESNNVNVLDINGINNEIDQFFNDSSNRTDINRLLDTLEVRIKRNKKIDKKSKKGSIKFLNDLQTKLNSGNVSKEFDKSINNTVNGILEPGQDTLQIELMGTK